LRLARPSTIDNKIQTTANTLIPAFHPLSCSTPRLPKLPDKAVTPIQANRNGPTKIERVRRGRSAVLSMRRRRSAREEVKRDTREKVAKSGVAERREEVGVLGGEEGVVGEEDK